MPLKTKKVSLIYFVILTLLLVGLVPLVLTGWFLSDKSGRELLSAENRYQIQLVQEKAKQIEIFGWRMSSIVSGLARGMELANDPAVISSAQTESMLGGLLRQNPDLLALYVKPANADSVTVFRAESLRREDVEAASVEAASMPRKNSLSVNGPHQMGGPGQLVMSFASDVNIGVNNAATIVAIASLKGISQGIVGVNAAKEEDLWNKGLPIVFVVNQAGETLFHPDPNLAAVKRPMNDLKIVQEWREAGGQVQSALVPFTATYNETSHAMIGAYSTARLIEGYSVG